MGKFLKGAAVAALSFGAAALPAARATIDDTVLTTLQTSLTTDLTSVNTAAVAGVTAAIGVGLTIFGLKYIAGLMMSTFQRFGRKG